MSKLKKALLLGVAYVAVAAIAIGGTLAYLTSKDSDVNVMTLGNVKIEQNEYQWNEDNTALEGFDQAKPLYPYVGELGWENTVYENGAYRQFTMNNVVDKYVTVKNIGKSDAYVRTIIAFELGSLTVEEFDTYIGASINSYSGGEYSFLGAWKWDGLDYSNVTEIDGHKYIVFTATHLAPLAPGEETVPSLLQVYMDKTATNEIVERIDGNGNGTYDIFASTQAIQSAGFEDAGMAWDVTTYSINATKFSAEVALDSGYGEITEVNHPWSEGNVAIPKFVDDSAALASALEDGGQINLNADVDYSGYIKKPTTLSLGNNALNSKGIEVNDDFSIVGGKYVMNKYGQYIDVRPTESDVYTFTNVEFINTYKSKPNSNVGSDQIEYVLKLYPMAPGVKSTFIFENCTFENSAVYFGASSDKPADIDVVFRNCTFNAMMGSDALIEFKSTTTGTVLIENCTFNIEGTYSNQAVIDISTWSSITLDVTATNNTLNANKATPYTYDPAKGETEADSVKLGTSNVRGYRLFDCLTGRYSTIVETGTVLTGDASAESR